MWVVGYLWAKGGGLKKKNQTKKKHFRKLRDMCCVSIARKKEHSKNIICHFFVCAQGNKTRVTFAIFLFWTAIW